MQIQDSDYRYLCNLIQTRTGLVLDEKRRDDVARAVNLIIPAFNLKTPHEVTLALARQATDTAMWRHLIDAVAIGETYFFRNLDQFNALQKHVLPELIAQRRASNHKSLRIWSAGCATGEEPYSLAILLRDLLPDIHTWNILILATDLNENSLEFARRGVYKSRSFRQETPDTVRARWFTAKDDTYTLDATARKMVRFAPMNLISDDYPNAENETSNLDLIICRNVTIYFSPESTHQVITRFYQALNRGGWLVVGHAESAASSQHDFIPRHFPNTVLYQKPSVPSTRHVHNSTEIPGLSSSAQTGEIQTELLAEARAAADRQDWEAASALLELAERDQGTRMQPEVHYLRGLVLLNTDDIDGSLRALRRALYCDPAFVLAHYTLGELYDRRERPKEARRHWRRAQNIIAKLDPQQHLPLTDELTAGMLNELLTYRLKSQHLDSG
jgi:chemotaxis protein methyltransferase CheR